MGRDWDELPRGRVRKVGFRPFSLISAGHTVEQPFILSILLAVLMHAWNHYWEALTLNTTYIRPGAQGQQRRSQRILLCVPIVVSGYRANGEAFSERTQTQVVNAHGALIQLSEAVLADQKIRMKNLSTGEETDCTVVDILSRDSGVLKIGVAFPEECSRFWRVSFPPDDWSPHNPEAKRVASIAMPGEPSPAKK